MVDDEPEIRTLVFNTLSPLGYAVLLAKKDEWRDGLFFQQHRGRVHLLMTDMLMPAMNGLELATKVHALSPKTRILYLSENDIVKGAFAEESQVPSSRSHSPAQS
ncbi:MAG TPA: response regulator [Nitrospiraceae bacterium]|nr:response regulator [Nitrospiraceae bacterium]